jgi:GH24 family phage-related lysozyme (muramidase)
MNYSDASLNLGKPKWLTQTVSDLCRMEGFRQFAYPDPLSKLGRRYASPKFGWGMSPARALLAKYGEKAEDGTPWTVGYGDTENITPDSQQTPTIAAKWLENNVLSERVKIANKLVPSWTTMPLFAQTTLLNLAYNLGETRLSKFQGTLQAFVANDWSGVGAHLEDSLWYKQVGARGRELVARMEDQQIDPRYQVV